MNHLMKSLGELTKWLIKFAISCLVLFLCIGGVFIAYIYVKEATSSKLIASAVGLIVMVFLSKFGEKVLNKLPELTFLKEGGKDNYERALFRSTWGAIAGFCLLAFLYGLVTFVIFSFILPRSLMDSIFHWSIFVSGPADLWTVFMLISVGALVGILINSDMRYALKNWFK